MRRFSILLGCFFCFMGFAMAQTVKTDSLKSVPDSVDFVTDSIKRVVDIVADTMLVVANDSVVCVDNVS